MLSIYITIINTMANFCAKSNDNRQYCINAMRNPYASNTHAQRSGGKTRVNCSTNLHCGNESQIKLYGSSTAPATDFVSTAGFFNGAHPGLLVTK